MFSKGQITFGILFFIVFVGIIIWTYRKDINLHKRYYKGAYWILIGFIVFLITLFIIKTLIYS